MAAQEPVEGIFDKTFDGLTQAMQVATLRQAVIAHNIANANTPGYEAMEFDKELMKAVKKRDQKQVVLEQEMADMAKNNMEYSAYVKLLSSKINVLKTIAGQGRR